MKQILKTTLLVGALIATQSLLATTTQPNLGDVAGNVTGSFKQIAGLIFGFAQIAGVGFGCAAIFKFKQHKDNPTQIPISTAFALLFVSVLLVFLPGIYKPAGLTIFGSTKAAGGFTGAGVTNMFGT